jgi:hypothetical protein
VRQVHVDISTSEFIWAAVHIDVSISEFIWSAVHIHVSSSEFIWMAGSNRCFYFRTYLDGRYSKVQTISFSFPFIPVTSAS